MTAHNDYKNYDVFDPIGEGRFAVVYTAKKLDIQKTVALKTLKPEFAARPELREQFSQQAKQQAKLSHPRLVRVEDLRDEHGQFFIALEYLPDGDLGSWTKQHDLLSFRQSAILIADVADVLDYLHNRKIVHGDVKPGNIILQPDPAQEHVLRAKLSDLRMMSEHENSQTVSESLLEGTAEYISPEEADGQTLTAFSDQYALGVTAYKLLTGTPPFTSDSVSTTYRMHKNQPPQPPSQRNSRVTRELDDVILRALEKDPAKRYSSCGEFARILRAAVASTEQQHFDELMKLARRALEKHDPQQADSILKDALLIQPENVEAQGLLERTREQEEQRRNYQDAVDALALAQERALAVRKEVPAYPDEAGLLKKFAPAPPSLAAHLYQRWQPVLRLAAVLLLLMGCGIFFLAAYIDRAASNTIKPALVAMDRTSTLTPTPTFTQTLTPTATSTSTSTFTLTPTFTITPTPTLLGGSGKIAFISNRDGNQEIYIMNADGSKPINLTDKKGNDNFPVWSPDGKKIAFYSAIDRYIYTTNINDGELNVLAKIISMASLPAWSPDGKKIAFTSYNSYCEDYYYYYSYGYGVCYSYAYRTQIYIMNADGSQPTNLTQVNRDDSSPIWSPDGKKIAFHSSEKIYVMNTDGSALTNLTKGLVSASKPIWSPDGKKIAFRSGGEIYVMNTDGSELINLTNSPRVDSSPIWSPDGKKITFTVLQNGNDEIYVMNADGSQQINLTNSSGNDDSPVWSPDGQKIAFVSNRDGNNEIYVMNADGSNPIRLTNAPADDNNPLWAP